MNDSQHYFDWPIYGVHQAEKDNLLGSALNELTTLHATNCSAYNNILKARQCDFKSGMKLELIPFLPVRLFKEYELRSVAKEDIFKILTSSGTTAQKVSRIVLDRATATAQTKALVKIIQDFLGKARLPMLIIDHPGIIQNRQSFSARGAGILGLSNFGREHVYALKDNTMEPDLDVLRAFAQRYRGERVFIFGFTFMVWKYFCEALRNHPVKPVFDDAILIHSGGWKKLQEQAVSNEIFKQTLAQEFGIKSVHNFYGMVEQVGSVFMECEHSRLHAPVFADVLIRNGHDWSVQSVGQSGMIQVLSALPLSYPGHSLLTEDFGEITGVDDCPCGRLGRTFQVHGRIAQAELRGCSDTHGLQVDQVS